MNDVITTSNGKGIARARIARNVLTSVLAVVTLNELSQRRGDALYIVGTGYPGSRHSLMSIATIGVRAPAGGGV